jgi:hypothetical protein
VWALVAFSGVWWALVGFGGLFAFGGLWWRFLTFGGF